MLDTFLFEFSWIFGRIFVWGKGYGTIGHLWGYCQGRDLLSPSSTPPINQSKIKSKWYPKFNSKSTSIAQDIQSQFDSDWAHGSCMEALPQMQ